MKVVARSPIIYKLIMFVILSIVHLHIVYALDADISALNINRLKGLMIGMPYLVMYSLFLIISIYNVKKYSIYLLMMFSIFIFYKTFTIFIIGFDKILLILNVIYLIVSYNFISIFAEELKSSVYNPNFELGSLFVDDYNDVEVELFDTRKGRAIKGTLSKLDERSFVVHTNENHIKGEVKVVFKYKRHVFTCIGKVVTKYHNGIGLRVTDKSVDQELDWSEFYQIKYRRGFV